jgi:CubicO group peptidase (beta-lactamase class C family)
MVFTARNSLCVLIPVLLLGCVVGQVGRELAPPGPLDHWPTDGWQISTPEAQGMDSELLAQAVEFALEEDFSVHSLLVVRNRYLVADAYFYPFAADTKHDLASCTKSVSSTLVGIAIDQGFIESVEEPVLGFFPERSVANLDDGRKAITLEDLLTMRNGWACESRDGEVTLFQMMASPDWTRFMLDLPMIEEPGTRFEYCSGGSHLLSVIIRQTTGMTALAFARKNLFDPLGIREVEWPRDPQGIDNRGWGDLRMKPHDMAKLGLLYLNGGQWDGEQLLSANYVAAATSGHARVGGRGFFDAYGYQWWVSSKGFYSARGRGGPYIFVAPAQNMVVVLTGGEALLRLGADIALADSEGVELPIGLDGAYRIAPGRFGIPAALKGWWERDDLFVVNMNEIGNINHWRIEVAFQGDEVEVSMQDATGLGGAEFGGRLGE